MPNATVSQIREDPAVVNSIKGDEKEGYRLASVFEKQLTNVIGLLLLAAVCWAGSQILDNNESMATQSEKIDSLGEGLNGVRSEVKGLQSFVSQQDKETALVKRELTYTEERLDKLEEAQGKLEDNQDNLSQSFQEVLIHNLNKPIDQEN